MEDQFVGALLGTFVGDALGMPVEGQTPQAITSTYQRLDQLQHARMGRGTYTDDTQLMIGVAESLVRCKGFDGADMAQTFLDNFDIKRGYGSGTIKVIMNLNRGKRWNEAGEGIFPGGSFGNGGAMRVAPVGLLYHTDEKKLRQVAEQSCSISHKHPLGMAGAVLQANAVRLALRAETIEPVKFLDTLHAIIKEDLYREQLYRIGELLKNDSDEVEVAEVLGNSVKAYESVPAAVFAFLKKPDSFEEAVVQAVHIGGDTDTIGAMTGAIAGAYHGYSQIPDKWLKPLENGKQGRDEVITLGKDLFACWKEVEP